MTINTYDVGELTRVSGLFEDANGVDADPSAVSFAYEDPSGNVTTLVFGVDAALVKDSVGNYHVDINVDEVGDWHWRWIATGTGQGAEQGQFMVKPTQVA